MSDKIICPTCGTEHEAETKQCFNCGLIFPEAPESSEPNDPEKIEDGELADPETSEEVAGEKVSSGGVVEKLKGIFGGAESPSEPQSESENSQEDKPVE